VDVYRAAYTAKTLNDFLFSEDVVIADVTGEFHHLAVHGPHAERILAATAGETPPLDDMRAQGVSVAGVDVIVARRDQTGEVGLELIVPYEQAEKVWETLLGGCGDRVACARSAGLRSTSPASRRERRCTASTSGPRTSRTRRACWPTA
jgi:glycine cleavage system aminomethyltransferase T